MKKITIIINGEDVSVEEKGSLAQIDRLTGLAVLAQEIRKGSTVSAKTTDARINKAVSRAFAEQLVKGVD